ncbi:MAG: hypothetical protein AAFV53_02100 [Myxococcota bacterium]
METQHTTLGDLITTLYAHFMDVYGDEELASVATAAMITEALADAEMGDEPAIAAA